MSDANPSGESNKTPKRRISDAASSCKQLWMKDIDNKGRFGTGQGRRQSHMASDSSHPHRWNTVS